MESVTPAGPSATLYQRIRRDIEANILSGLWPPGYRVPFEHELVEIYACSRMTVNKVMTDLATAGLIERKRRAGSVVARPRAQQALLSIPDLKAEVEGRGARYGYELLYRERRAARRADADRLGVQPRSPILALRCRHRTDGRPFALEDRLLNLSEIPEAEREDFSVVPPNTWLVGYVPWTGAEHSISACHADAEAAALLEIEPGHACLSLERRTWRGNGSVTAVTMLHPGHLYRLFARFTP
ncbi:histidine utilization repressor [Methylobacterium sp. J-030]|uniref:histidine utilization repressor n=1 Tax=Methylobacterium sp. J-030 TaxID=2836627 RepID=UPI001FB88A93|nr:histidine utilization repressor [Methylobacterium sp. J-030]MCJ2071349.1 histidine utilization repressor [Methylobacterium sp. J-030]